MIDHPVRTLSAFFLALGIFLSGAAPSPVRADECPDAWITAKVKTRIMGKSGFSAFTIDIETDACVVALNGCVDTSARRDEAAAVARKVKKVKEVRNLLTICDDEHAGADIIDECPDAMLTAEVKSLIFALEGFSAFKIDVDTEECVVTLDGCVETNRQIEAATRAAKKAKGVKSVRSALTICPD